MENKKYSVVDQLEQLVLKLNKTAMTCLQYKKTKKALRLLNRALQSLQLSKDLAKDETIGETL